MEFSKATRKLLGKLYVSETATKQDNLVEELLKEPWRNYDIPDYRVRVVVAARKIIDRQREERYMRRPLYGPEDALYNGFAQVLNRWTRYTNESGESWTHVLIMKARDEKEAHMITRYSIPGGIDGHGTGSLHDCSGRSFHYSADIREVYPGRWIATQWGALDV